MRTNVLRESGGYETDLPHAADFALWMRAAIVSDVGYVAGADQAYYRNHAHNMHHSKFDMLDDFLERLASFDSIFNKFSESLEGADSMRDMAHRALARNALSQAIRDTAYRALAHSALRHLIFPFLRGTYSDELTGDYAAFALKAWPDAKQLREWAVLDRLTKVNRDTPELRPSLITRMAVRKLRTRVGEWRWSLTGT
jgi:hypothetical protein